MAVEPTGMLSKPLGHARTLLAACESFQGWVGVAAEDLGEPEGIAEALEHIHLVAFEDAAQGDQSEAAYRAARSVLRPLAVLALGSDFFGDVDAEPAGYFRHGGSIVFIFEHLADPGEAGLCEADAALTFSNAVGAILEEVEALSGTATYLHVTGHRKQFGPARWSGEDVKAGQLEVYQVSFEISWSEG